MKTTKIILFITVILFTGIDSFSQIDLGRIRDKGSDRVRDKRNREQAIKEQCTNQRKTIEGRIATLKQTKEEKSEYGIRTFSNVAKQARTENEAFRNDCPSEAEKYADNIDHEINLLEEWYENFQKEQSQAAAFKEETEAMINAIYWGANDIKNFLSRASSISGLGTHLERNTINAEKISQIEELVSNYPDYQNSSFEYGGKCRQILDFRKEMEEEYNSFIVNGINSQIEEAYSLKGRGKNSFTNAVKAVEIAITGAKFLLNIFPENSDFQQLKKDALATKTAIYDKYGDEVFTSDFHIENAGGIVFSTKPLIIKQEDKSLIKDDFNATDDIYATVYLKGTLSDLSSHNEEVYIVLYVNDDRTLDRRWHATKQEMDESFYAIELIPDPATSITRGAIEYSKMFSELSPRKQKIRAEFRSSRVQHPLAQGEFTLDLSTGREEVQNKAKALHNKQLSTVRMPAPKMRNANLESQMKNALSSWAGEVQRVVITDNDWQIHRNSISGVIEFRSIGTTVAIKNDDGTCKMVWVSFKQDYSSGSYGRTVQYGVGGTDAIACENVNK